MKQFVIAIALFFAVTCAQLRAEDKPGDKPAPNMTEQSFEGHLIAKKKDAKSDVVAQLKTDAKTYQVVAKSDDIAKLLKGLADQAVTAKGTVDGETLTVTS